MYEHFFLEKIHHNLFSDYFKCIVPYAQSAQGLELYFEYSIRVFITNTSRIAAGSLFQTLLVILKKT